MGMNQTRRRLLQVGGATMATTLIAGCGDTEDEEGAPEDPTEEDEDGGLDGGEDDQAEAEEGTGNGQDADEDDE